MTSLWVVNYDLIFLITLIFKRRRKGEGGKKELTINFHVMEEIELFLI